MARYGERTRLTQLSTNSRLVSGWFGTGFVERPYSPELVPNLHSWYDASNAASIASSGGAVSQWNDLSGNNRHASQATSAYRPTTGTTTQNGRNVIVFNGTTQFLLADASITSNALTLFSVYRRYTNAAGAYSRLFSLFNSGGTDYDNTNSIEVHASSVSFSGITPPLIGGYRNSAQISGNTIAYNTSYLFSATLDGGAWSQNNSGVVTTGTTSTASLNVNKNNVGAGSLSGGGDAYFSGWFAEQLVYTRVLTATEISDTRAYLAAKWGVS